MPLLTVKALRERMGELHDQATALTKLAEKENRDLTAEEKTAFDGHMAAYNQVKDQDLPRAEWLETEQARLAQARQAVPMQAADRGDTHAEAAPRASRIVIPAQARFRTGKLVAYRGQHADESAYLSGMFLMASLFKSKKASAWCKEHGVAIRHTTFQDAMGGSANTSGGFLVPAEMEQAIIDLREEYGVFRRNAYQTPMAGDTKTVPRRAGGLTAYFVGENSEITESEKAWDQVALTARKLAVLARYSNEISEDAIISLADDLTREVAYAFAVKEDQCGFVGTGASAYGGIQGLVAKLTAATAGIITAATGNTAFGTLDLADFESMVGLLPQYPGISPKWYISKPGWAASMLRLLDAAGGNTSANLSGGAPPQFLGYDVEFVKVMNATLTAQTSVKGLCLFGDLKLSSTMGTRRGILIALSNDRYFEFDQIGIRGTERFDIVNHDCGSTTAAGPVVMMATPAN